MDTEKVIIRPFGGVEKLQPAKRIIEALGGVQRVSEIARVSRGRVYGWMSPRGSRSAGTGGIIPHWHIQNLLDYADRNDIPLTASDFTPVDLRASQRKLS